MNFSKFYITANIRCDWSTTAWSVQSLWNFTRIKSILRPIASNKKIIVSYFLWLDIAGSIFGNYAVVLQVLKRHHFQILTLLDILYIKIDLLITSNCVLQKFLESDITSKSYGLSKFWTVLLVDQYFFLLNTYHVVYQNTSHFCQELKSDGTI